MPYQHHRSTQTSSKSAMDGSVSFRTKGQMNGRATEQPRERVSERERVEEQVNPMAKE